MITRLPVDLNGSRSQLSQLGWLVKASALPVLCTVLMDGHTMFAIFAELPWTFTECILRTSVEMESMKYEDAEHSRKLGTYSSKETSLFYSGHD
jgi:hypothetical protein